MDCQIYLDGDNVTSEIIQYSRQQSLCTSIGSFNLTVKGTSTHDYSPGGEIVIYEGGVKKGTYFIGVNEKQINQGKTFVVSGQDNSKRIQEWFVTESYTINYPSSSKYWIQKFLDEAGVNYTFTTSEVGTNMSNNTVIGMSTAYDIILPLLQQNGWFLKFDADGDAIIGKLYINVDSTAVDLDDTVILDVQVSTDDRMLRNRAIVWGNSNPFTQDHVYALQDRKTGYETSSQDIRPIVLSNTYIYDNETAYELASQMLDEFARLTEVKTIQAAGVYDAEYGDTIYVNSMGWEGFGIVTNLQVDMSKSGLTTTFTLDQRCPRIVAYFGSRYVYVGTEGNGVWRKPIDYPESNWEDYSAGLVYKNIQDLKIYKGKFACIANRKAYVRTTKTNWVLISPGTFTDSITGNVYQTSDVVAAGVTINRKTLNIYILYVNMTNNKSWVVTVSSAGRIYSKTQVLTPQDKNVRGFDIDIFRSKAVITGVQPTRYKDYKRSRACFTRSLNVSLSDPYNNANGMFSTISSVDQFNTIKGLEGGRYTTGVGTARKLSMVSNEYYFEIGWSSGTGHTITRYSAKSSSGFSSYGTGIDGQLTFTLLSDNEVLHEDRANGSLKVFNFNTLTSTSYSLTDHVDIGVDIEEFVTFADSNDVLHIIFLEYTPLVNGSRIGYTTFDLKLKVFGTISYASVDRYYPEGYLYLLQAYTSNSVYGPFAGEADSGIIGWVNIYESDLITPRAFKHFFFLQNGSISLKRIDGTVLDLLNQSIEVIPDFLHDVVYFYFLDTSNLTEQKANYFYKVDFSQTLTLVYSTSTTDPDYDANRPKVVVSKNKAYILKYNKDVISLFTGNTVANLSSLTGYNHTKTAKFIDDYDDTIIAMMGSPAIFPYKINTTTWTATKIDYLDGLNLAMQGQIYAGGFNVYYPTTTIDPTGGGYATYLETDGRYAPVDYLPGPCVLEISQEAPIMTYALPWTSDLLSGYGLSGVLSSGMVMSGELVNNFRLSFYGTSGTFYNPSGVSFTSIQYSGAAIKFIHDARTLYYGAYGDKEFEYVAIANNDFLSTDTAFSGEFMPILSSSTGLPSGIVRKIETANFETLYFAANSGTTFYEYIPYITSGYFVDGTTNLPSGFPITIIRLDDRI